MLNRLDPELYFSLFGLKSKLCAPCEQAVAEMAAAIQIKYKMDLKEIFYLTEAEQMQWYKLQGW